MNLQIVDLEKKIKQTTIFSNINISVNPTDIFCILGRNGIGKTTLLKTIVGLQRQTSGSILYSNETINKNDIGFLLENHDFYPFLNGYDHIVHTLKNKNINEQDSYFPYLKTLFNLESFIHKKCKTYSLGQNQKLAICLAVIAKPKIIILDEPTNSLDIEAIFKLRQLLSFLKSKGHIILLTSHNISEVSKVSNRILYMKSSTEHEELKFKEGENMDLEEYFKERVI
ncbi:ABC transporter ATP-binding protein [Robertmurraya massiliosenegalensis]|uniref:ABC transporter ATP-binding protein n=1 Tax=Robertmurraya TaxID=2837507 RepID=UPI0039A546C2